MTRNCNSGRGTDSPASPLRRLRLRMLGLSALSRPCRNIVPITRKSVHSGPTVPSIRRTFPFQLAACWWSGAPKPRCVPNRAQVIDETIVAVKRSEARDLEAVLKLKRMIPAEVWVGAHARPLYLGLIERSELVRRFYWSCMQSTSSERSVLGQQFKRRSTIG